MIDEKKAVLATRAEEESIGRKLMVWLNTYQPVKELTYNGQIDYETLPADTVCMAMSTIQGAYITRRYIGGGHQAEYQFKIIYRVKAATGPKKLDADIALDAYGDWASTNKPDLGVGISNAKVQPMSRSALFAAYDNGDEDHQILMKLTYEVI